MEDRGLGDRPGPLQLTRLRPTGVREATRVSGPRGRFTLEVRPAAGEATGGPGAWGRFTGPRHAPGGRSSPVVRMD
ncbi:hypothetical protein FTX61_06330 [Nitriliruptoraceae bacterium ZYF776]|nr:hypothetical protein [Profundirhabdus halotolerans]